MIKEVTMYTVICDNCGCDSNEHSEYAAWNHEGFAKDSARDSGWLMIHGGKDYCSDCFSYDDNDNVILSESRCKTIQ